MGAGSKEGEKKQNNLEVACWNHPNLSLQRSEIWFHDQMIHLVDLKNTHNICENKYRENICSAPIASKSTLLLFPTPTPSTHVGVFCCCCSCCCCFCDILVVVLTRILFYLTVAIVLQLPPKATNAPQPDPSWLNKHLQLRQTRVDSSLWPRGTVPESPSGTKGCKTSICPTLLTT